MRLWIRRVLLGLLAAGIVGVIVYAFLPKPVGVDLAPVTRGPLRVTVDEDGKTRIRERYEVSSPLAGRMSRIELKPGDRVEAGRTLLTVLEPPDPALLERAALTEAEARVKEAEGEPERAAAAVREAQIAHDFARSAVARGHSSRRGTAAQDLEDLEHKERAAAQKLRAAQVAQQMADARLELARAALVRSRPRSPGDPNGSRLEVRAPITGQVLRVFQESAAVVTAGQRLVELGDPADLECVIDVLSADAVKVEPKAKVLLEHWGGEQPLQGRVRRVEPSGFLKISALGVEEQRVNVLVDFVDPLEKRPTLGDAYRVEARIVVWEGADVLKVPASVLFRRGDGWAVFVAAGGRAVLRPVQVGRNNGLEAQVLEGLGQGDEVVVHPGDKIKDGVLIAPRTAGH